MRHILGSCVLIVWLGGCGGSATPEDPVDDNPVGVRSDGGKVAVSDALPWGGGGGTHDATMAVQKGDAASTASDARASAIDAGHDAAAPQGNRKDAAREDAVQEDAPRRDGGKVKPPGPLSDGGLEGPGDDGGDGPKPPADGGDGPKPPADGGDGPKPPADGGRPGPGGRPGKD